VRPHNLVFIRLLSKGNLLDKLSLKGKKNTVDKTGVPGIERVVSDQITNQILTVIRLSGKGFESILLRDPVILPDINLVA
jgi:hypothetical protein